MIENNVETSVNCVTVRMNREEENMDYLNLAEEIIQGRRLKSRDDCRPLLEAETEEELAALRKGADSIRKALCGDKVDLCSIINGRKGGCSENCKFCAQSGTNCTGIGDYGFLPDEVFLEDCDRHYRKGVDRYSIVTAGRKLSDKDLDDAVRVFRKMHERYTDIGLCASHGLESQEAFDRLKDAGVDTVHCNIETSRRYFPEVCTTHTFEDKLETIQRAQKAGLRICCGGIIGMGETWQDRVDMALTIAEIGASSVPLNVLVPIPGTPFQNLKVLSQADILKTVAIFRYINPDAQIRIAAGRYRFPDGGTELFTSGANATITGDMLTTTGNNIQEDRTMLQDMGFQIHEVPEQVQA